VVSVVSVNLQDNTNSKHERIVVPGLLPCSIVGCPVSVALLRFPRLFLAASQNPSTLWMHSCFTLVYIRKNSAETYESRRHVLGTLYTTMFPLLLEQIYLSWHSRRLAFLPLAVSLFT
jgi:hypothetical protein